MASATIAAPFATESRRWGPEHTFAALVACFGLVFAFAMPPCQTPDEPTHFIRSYHVSEGHPAPTQMVGNFGGGEVPVSILFFPMPFVNLPFQPQNQTNWNAFARAAQVHLMPDFRRAVPFPGSTYYSFVPYVPQALGVAVARAAGGGPLVLFYAGRLANLALAVVLVFWAIRITPIFKLVFGMVALIPMTVHQFASMSPDASTIGVGFLLSAVFLRLAVGPRGPATRGELGVLFALTMWMVLCKFPYAALVLLYLAVPARRLGSRLRYVGVGLTLMLVVVALAGALTQLKKFTPDGMPLPGSTASLKGQMSFIRHFPGQYFQVVTATVAEHGKIWLDQLSMLGWLDTTINPLAVHLFFAFLGIVALGDRSGGERCPTLRLRLIALFAAVLCGTVIITTIYVCGCPVASKLIIGPQGRYFLPFVPMLLLPLSNRMIRVQAAPELLQSCAAAAGTAVLLVAVAGVVRRYYLPLDDQLWVSPLALAAALVLFGGVTFWAWFRQRRRELGSRVTATTIMIEAMESRRMSGVALGSY